jgi:hypothetical protein
LRKHGSNEDRHGGHDYHGNRNHQRTPIIDYVVPEGTAPVSSSRGLRSGSEAPQPGGQQSLESVTSDGAVVVLKDGSVYAVDSGDRSTSSSWQSNEAITVDEGEESLTNLESGEKVTAKQVGKTSDANPYPNTGDHTQDTNDSNGSIVVLDDGSIWAVESGDQSMAESWNDGASITVNEESAGGGYKLVNTDEHEIVHANYIGDE